MPLCVCVKIDQLPPKCLLLARDTPHRCIVLEQIVFLPTQRHTKSYANLVTQHSLYIPHSAFNSYCIPHTQHFASPRMSRRGSQCDIDVESFPCQLSPIPIGTKHFAVLCIPVAASDNLSGNLDQRQTKTFGVPDGNLPPTHRGGGDEGSSSSGSGAGNR